MQKLVAEAEKTDTVLAIAVALAAITGARRGELCALRWSDVDWQRRTLTISRSLSVVNNVVAEGPTKTHQRRDTAVDDALGAFLTRRRAEQVSYAGTVGVEVVDDPFVLSRSADGSEPCLPDGLTHQYQRLANRWGVVATSISALMSERPTPAPRESGSTAMARTGVPGSSHGPSSSPEKCPGQANTEQAPQVAVLGREGACRPPCYSRMAASASGNVNAPA
ncbi:MAG TPA: tyrosine-type recombinase/integrase [Acidimicrobiales bacterium]|nr:tyrosine-type recombinase/integrase [Acidimicrobiales bacterium]